MTILWILEVQKFRCGGFEHVGYLNVLFKTKRSAGDYYDALNPRMRKLNAHNTWTSDWDPDTYLRYIVRRMNNEILQIEASPEGLEYLKHPFIARDNKSESPGTPVYRFRQVCSRLESFFSLDRADLCTGGTVCPCEPWSRERQFLLENCAIQHLDA